MRNKTLINVTFLSLLFLIASCEQHKGVPDGELELSLAKNFSLESLNGKGEISLEDFKGKAVVVNFWATWCGPCKQEMPFFEKTWREYKDKEVIFIGIDVMDDKDSAIKFIDKLGVSYINLYDPSGKTSNSYRVV